MCWRGLISKTLLYFKIIGTASRRGPPTSSKVGYLDGFSKFRNGSNCALSWGRGHSFAIIYVFFSKKRCFLEGSCHRCPKFSDKYRRDELLILEVKICPLPFNHSLIRRNRNAGNRYSDLGGVNPKSRNRYSGFLNTFGLVN